MPLAISELKPYIPAKDFKLSKSFYQKLGFNMSEGWGGTADFELGGHFLRLQDLYVKAWAENTMIVMTVDDVQAWAAKANEISAMDGFKAVSVQPIEEIGDSLVLHVHDPSGVLLVFVQ